MVRHLVHDCEVLAGRGMLYGLSFAFANTCDGLSVFLIVELNGATKGQLGGVGEFLAGKLLTRREVLMSRCMIVPLVVLANKSFVKVEKFIRKEILLQFQVLARRKELLQLECIVIISIVAIFIAGGKLLLRAMVLVDGKVLANSRKLIFVFGGKVPLRAMVLMKREVLLTG